MASVYRDDRQPLIWGPAAEGEYETPAYNNRTMSDHELVVFKDGTQTLFTWNLLDQKQLCAGGYYNNPWGEIECPDTATHRQRLEMQRLHAAISSAANPTRAVALQECMLPNTDLGFDTDWSVHRSGQLVLAVHDPNAMRIKWPIAPTKWSIDSPDRCADEAMRAAWSECATLKEQCNRFITSEGDERAVFVYSPKFKTTYIGVHIKWVCKDDVDAVNETVCQWAVLCDYAMDVFNTRRMFALGDFNMINERLPGIQIALSINEFARRTNDMFPNKCLLYAPPEYTNVHREKPSPESTKYVEACTSSDYVLDFAIRVPTGSEYLDIIDSDLVVLPPELKGHVQLGCIVELQHNGKTLALDTDGLFAEPDWHVYRPLFWLFTGDTDATAKPPIVPSYVVDAQGRRNLYIRPTFCCKLDLAAFAQEQLDDLPTGDHIVVVAMYGGRDAVGMSFEPVAVALMTLTIKTTPRTDGAELVYDRTWSYNPLPSAAISKLQQQMFVVDTSAFFCS